MSTFRTTGRFSQNTVFRAVRGWLRHSATSLKVAGSIPYGVIGIFHSRNPSGRTQTPTEMSTRDISLGGGGRCTRLTTLPTSCADCVESLAA